MILSVDRSFIISWIHRMMLSAVLLKATSVLLSIPPQWTTSFIRQRTIKNETGSRSETRSFLFPYFADVSLGCLRLLHGERLHHWSCPPSRSILCKQKVQGFLISPQPEHHLLRRIAGVAAHIHVMLQINNLDPPGERILLYPLDILHVG